MKLSKTDIRRMIAPLYHELGHSDKQNVQTTFNGITAHAGKAYKRSGFVAWKVAYCFVLPNGKNTGYQWESLAEAVDGLMLWLKAENLQ